MSPLWKAYCIFRYLGPGFVWARANILLKNKMGRSRRVFAPRPWDQIRLTDITRAGTPTDPEVYARFKREQIPTFLFPPGRPPEIPESIVGAAVERQPPFARRLELLEQNRCVYFFRTPAPRAIDWHENPFDNLRSNPEKTWCDIPDYLPEQGDPRMLWEPARAAWAIDLARASARSLGSDPGGLFWRWVDSWMDACPPYRGFQWKCGQESSVRLIAIALGFWSLADDPATTPERWVQFARLAWATGYRVRHHIDYAISQKNNHAMSEACGLLVITQLFPEFREANQWRSLARQVLAQEIRRQTYSDGSYLQQSMNYQRVMLHGSMLGLRLAELTEQPFDRDVYDCLARCGDFLFEMMDPDTGRLPQYGNNDGAYVLPLSECDFTDFRPAIQATHYLAHRRRLLPAGPWDEDLIWLFGPDALHAEDPPARRPSSKAFDVGGYYTLRRRDSWGMIRCHAYHDRPSQCDQLHFDLWWRGQNILRDSGTYRYYVPDRSDIECYFKFTASHNNVAVDGREPMERASRFQWFPWSRSWKRHFQANTDGLLYFEGETYDYDRRPSRVLHRRTLLGLQHDTWVVVDDLLGRNEHEIRLRWHMLDAPYELDFAGSSVRLQTPVGDAFVTVTGRPAAPHDFDVSRGRDDAGRIQGWESRYYGERLPIPTLEARWRCPLPLRIITVVSPGAPARPELANRSGNRESWELPLRDETWTLELADPNRSAQKVLLNCTRAGDSPTSRDQ